MLESLRRLEARVECFDLGLSPEERRTLPVWSGVRHRRFDYGSYPPFMDVNVNAGEYAWKPVIVADVVDEARRQPVPADVLWADAGCFFHELEPIGRRVAASGGLWVRTSAGTMAQWTHPGMFASLQADPRDYAGKPNADATLVGFAVGSGPADRREAVYRNVVAPWKACALDRNCIAPAGSSRRNHRQDQAVLSYLVHRAGYRFAHDSARDIGVCTKCDRWFYHYLGFRVPAAMYARTCLS